MPFTLEAAREILSRTPATLDSLLRGLADGWSRRDEGADTWSPFDVLGHLNPRRADRLDPPGEDHPGAESGCFSKHGSSRRQQTLHHRLIGK